MERAGAYRALPFARVVLFVSALAFLGIGVPFLVAPIEMTGFVGVSLAGATADNDVRAVYGGLQIACGLILLVCASRAAWLRLGRAAAGSNTSLALLTSKRQAGTFSDLALELRPLGTRFSPAPALLEGLESRATLVRNRLGPPGHESPWILTA